MPEGGHSANSRPAGRRLTLVISSLAGGGAERVLSQLANHWAQSGRDVTLITLSAESGDRYPLVASVRRVALDLLRDSANLPAAVWNNAVRVLRLRRALKKSQPDVVVSFTETVNVLTLSAVIGLGLDVVVSERIDPARHHVGPFWSRLRRLLYPRCRALVVQTERVGERFRDVARGRPIYVIPNAAVAPHPRPSDTAGPNRNAGCRTVLAMGRLDPQKGFDLLIDAFSQIADRHPQWSVQILGEGSQRAELEQLVRERRLDGRVSLAGWTPDPSRELQQADLFVLSSRYEGFPNAVLEAMACGRAVVSFDCDSGPAEIVRHETDGLLVPAEDVAALARAMERLMSDESERGRFAERARDVLDRFHVDRFFERWDAVVSGDEPSVSPG